MGFKFNQNVIISSKNKRKFFTETVSLILIIRNLKLEELVLKYSSENFKEISHYFGKRSGKECSYDFNKVFYNKNSWNGFDDLRLVIGADIFSKKWNLISKIIFDFKYYYFIFILQIIESYLQN